jgi:hypothetical protein
MKALGDSFEKLVGMLPSDEERQDLFRARDALNIKDNDALWPLLVMLRHYQTVYATVPGLIKQTVTEVLRQARKTAEADLKAASARAEADLARSVADTAGQIADKRASTKRWQWISVSLAIGLAALTTVDILSQRSGRAAGYSDGYQAARDERAADAWANTPEGQLAYGLSKAGTIRMLATCSGRGWTMKDGFCYPHPENGSVYGWRIRQP